jgi:hypothetical protein
VKVVVHRARDTKPPRISELLQPSRNIDAISVDVPIRLDNDIAEV